MNGMWSSFWILLLSCFLRAEAFQDLESGISCTCRLPEDCHTNSKDIDNHPPVFLPSCESENFIKCCYRTSNETQSQDRSSYEDMQPQMDSRNFISLTMKKILSLIHPMKQELSTRDLSVTPQSFLPSISSEKVEASGSSNTLNSEMDITTMTSVNGVENGVSPAREKEVKEPLPLRIRILDHIPLEMIGVPLGPVGPLGPVAYSLPQYEEVKKKQSRQQSEDMVTQNEKKNAFSEENTREDESLERFLHETASFESQRLQPKAPNAANLRRRILKKRNNLYYRPGSVQSVNNDQGDKLLLKFDNSFKTEKEKMSKQQTGGNMQARLSAKLGNPSEKVSDFLMQKTLLDTPLTPDRISTQAADEKRLISSSKLNHSLDDRTFIRYLQQEEIKNVVRPVRSRLSKFTAEENSDGKGSSEVFGSAIVDKPSKANLSDKSKSVEQSTVLPTSRFRRPPRVLPKRINFKTALPNPTVYRNPKERALDLYNQSNKKSKDRASLIINKRRQGMKSHASSDDMSSRTLQQNVSHLRVDDVAVVQSKKTQAEHAELHQEERTPSTTSD